MKSGGVVISRLLPFHRFSGSDVASMTTRATLSEDGRHYLLSGTKVREKSFSMLTHV